MGAAAQLARKVVDQVSRIPDWFSAKLGRRWWTAIPNDAIENMDRKLNPTEGSIYRNICRLTVGNAQQNRPEQIQIRHEEFAEWANVDKRHITNALKFLRENKVIQCEERGRYVLYSILDFSLAKLPDRKPRTLDRVEEEEQAPDQVAAEDAKRRAPMTVRTGKLAPGGKYRYKDDVTGQVIQITTSKQFPFEIDAELHRKNGNWRVQVEPFGNAFSDRGTGVPLPISSPKGKVGNHGTGVPRSSVQTDLQETFVPLFEGKFHYTPDQAMLEKIAKDLGSTPVLYFVKVVVWPKFDSRYEVKPGIFIGSRETPGLAKEAAEKWSKLSPKMQQAYLPKAPETPAPPRPTCKESETSGSTWMKIRLRLKGEVHAVEYDNWFTSTRFDSLKSGELVVRVADDVTRDFMEQEYLPRIEAAAAALQLNVKSFRFLPVGV